jgi:hypothetical protein
MTAVLLRLAAVIALLVMGVIVAVQYDSLSWPHTPGVIAISERERSFGLNGAQGALKVRYDYKVDGVERTGSRVSYNSDTGIVRVLKAYADDAENVERTPQPGDVVNVHYASWWPVLSVLVPGPSPTIWVWAAVTLLFSIVLWAFARISNHPLY